MAKQVGGKSIRLTGSTPKAPSKYTPKKAETPKQAGGQSIQLKGDTPKAPTPAKVPPVKRNYSTGKRYVWESNIFKRFGI